MSRIFARRWIVLALAAVAGFALVLFGNTATSTVLLVLAIAFVLALTTPVLYPRSLSDAESRTLAEQRSVPLIYWRRGCIFCFRLRIALLLSGRKAVWTSVDRDAAASARVRAVNDGDETVPTVFLGSAARTNPDPSWVIAQFDR